MKNLSRTFFTSLIASLIVLLLLPTTALAGGGQGDDEGDDGRVVVKKRVRPRIVVECNEDAEDCWTHARGRLRKVGYLGVELTDLTPELRQHFGVDAGKGVMVSRVVEDSPAAAAGLQVGDILVGLSGKDVTSAGDVGHRVFRLEEGALLDITFVRNGRADATTATITARERPGYLLDDIVIDFPHLGDVEIPRFDAEAFEKAMEAVGTAFEDIDWDARLGDWRKRIDEAYKAYENIDVNELDERMELLQEQLKDLEKRLERELEDQLEKDYGKGGHTL